MKKSILSLLMLVFAGVTATVFAQGVTMGAAIEFEKEVHDYGDVEYEGNGSCEFVFKNTGSEPLMITDAKGSCGCTVPTWPKEPIAPGASASIEVKYDTKRVGPISKSVTITSNAVNTPVKVVRIAGNVMAMPVLDETVPPLQVLETIEPVKVEPLIEIAPSVPLTEAEIKAMKKAEKKRIKAEEKARKKEAKLALKAEKSALKAEAKLGKS